MSKLAILESELEDIKKTISVNPGIFIVAVMALEAREIMEKIKALKKENQHDTKEKLTPRG